MMQKPPSDYSVREWRFFKCDRGLVHVRGFNAFALKEFAKQPLKPTGTHCGRTRVADKRLLAGDFVATKPVGTECSPCLLWLERCEGMAV